MDTFPTFTTERVMLGPIHSAYYPEIVALANNYNISYNLLSLPYPYAEKDAKLWHSMHRKGFANKTHYIFAITSLQSEKFMGGMGLMVDQANNIAELGYWLGEPYWGQGIVTEAAQRILQFGFEELDLHKIHASHIASNIGSGKVLQKLGMHYEGTRKQHLKREDYYVDLVYYGLLREEHSL